MKRDSVLLGGIAAGVLMVTLAGTAHARTAEDPKDQRGTTAQATEGPGMGDIIVTAQKRSQTLQSVPVAATAVTAEALQQKNVVSIVDLPKLAPSLNITTPYGAVGPEITMRGIGTASFNQNTETTVATYMDEFVLNVPSSKLGQLFDLERVEVLRGPQGTLYGKNSTGGAINFITRRPTGATGGDGSVTVERFGTYDVRLGFQTALTDKLSVRVSGARHYSDGYAFNTLDNRHLNNADNWAGRIGIRYKDDGIDLYLKGFYDSEKTNGAIYYPQGVNAAGAPTPNGVNPLTGYVPPANIDVAGSQPSDNRANNTGVTLNADIAIGKLTLTSVSGYLHSFGFLSFDADGSPFDLINDTQTSKTDQVTQEFRISSPSDDRFTWIAGASFFYQNQDIRIPVNIPLFGLPTIPQHFHEKSRSFAGFVDGTFKLTDRLEIIAGVRLTSDHKEFQEDASFSLVGPFTLTDSHTWTKPTYRAGLNYHLGRTLLYASYNRGYRSGAYDTGFITSPAQLGRPVNPEYVNSYEAGVKTTAFDRYLQIAVAGFYTQYIDQQLPIVPPGGICCSLVNAGKSRVFGVEAEGVIRVTPNFEINFSGDAIDSKYLNFSPGPSISYAGYVLGRAPTYELRLAPEYRYPVGSGQFFLAPEVQFTGKQRVQTMVDAFGQDIQRPYTIVNGQLGYRAANGKFSAFVFVKNATNKRYLTYFANVGATMVNQVYYAAPRTFGITLTGGF